MSLLGFRALLMGEVPESFRCYSTILLVFCQHFFPCFGGGGVGVVGGEGVRSVLGRQGGGEGGGMQFPPIQGSRPTVDGRLQ
jgi:hypothetical protein